MRKSSISEPRRRAHDVSAFCGLAGPGGNAGGVGVFDYQKTYYSVPGKVAAIDAAMEKYPEGSHGFTPAGSESQEMMETMLLSVPAKMWAAVPTIDQQFQTFSPSQLRAVATKVGLEVDSVEYADGRLRWRRCFGTGRLRRSVGESRWCWSRGSPRGEGLECRDREGRDGMECEDSR